MKQYPASQKMTGTVIRNLRARLRDSAEEWELVTHHNEIHRGVLLAILLELGGDGGGGKEWLSVRPGVVSSPSEL